MGENGKMTARQAKALTALLTCGSMTEAARVAGVSRRTIHAYLELETFRQALAKAQATALETAGRRLTHAAGVAIETLIQEATGSERPADRIRAAGLLVEAWQRYQNADIERRLTAVEEKLYDVI